MFFVERMGLLQRLSIQPIVILSEHLLADGVAQPVIDDAAGNGSDKKQQHQNPDIHGTGRAQGAADKQQRITRQKKQHQQRSFTEYDGKQQGIDQGAILHNDDVEILIKMQCCLKELQEMFPGSVMAVYELSKNTNNKCNVKELFVNNFLVRINYSSK